MRSSPLVLLLLIGVQAVLNMGGGRALSTGGGAANHKAGQQTAAANHRSGQQQTAAAGDRLSEHRSSSSNKDHQRTSSSHVRTRRPHRAASEAHHQGPVDGVHRGAKSDSSSIPEVDPKLFSKRRYRSSPRVVFSEVAPSHHALEGEGGEGDGMMKGVRVRRRSGSQPMHRGEYSVCDSINTWVGNLTRATDIAGNEVTVLPNVKIDNVVKKQFFYETTCRSPTTHSRPPGGAPAGPKRGGKQGNKSGGGNSGCRGIDARHWNSYCTNTHTYVRALTIFKNQTAWRLIRINAACVCVLSRKSWGGRLGH